jgi:hypothetical protein
MEIIVAILFIVVVVQAAQLHKVGIWQGHVQKFMDAQVETNKHQTTHNGLVNSFMAEQNIQNEVVNRINGVRGAA